MRSAKITRDGVFLEELEHNPAKYLPEVDTSKLGGEVVKIDLNKPMKGNPRAAHAGIRSRRGSRSPAQ